MKRVFSRPGGGVEGQKQAPRMCRGARGEDTCRAKTGTVLQQYWYACMLEKLREEERKKPRANKVSIEAYKSSNLQQ